MAISVSTARRLVATIASVILIVAAPATSANQCDAAIADLNTIIDEVNETKFDWVEQIGISRSSGEPVGSLQRIYCEYGREMAPLLKTLAEKRHQAEQVCGPTLSTRCDSTCVVRDIARNEDLIARNCVAGGSSPRFTPSERPNDRAKVGVCACFSLQQLTRAGSQFPFRAVNNCPAAVSYTYVSCDGFSGSVQCKEVVGYIAANSSDSTTGYNYGQETHLVRACGPGGQCCTP